MHAENVKFCSNLDCKHPLGICHDSSGCKRCRCKLNQYGNPIDTGFNSQVSKYTGIGLRISAYSMLVIIIIANANFQILSYFVSESTVTEEQKLKALEAIRTLTIFLGILSIAFSEIGAWVSRSDSDAKRKEVETRLREVERWLGISTDSRQPERADKST